MSKTQYVWVPTGSSHPHMDAASIIGSKSISTIKKCQPTVFKMPHFNSVGFFFVLLGEYKKDELLEAARWVCFQQYTQLEAEMWNDKFVSGRN